MSIGHSIEVLIQGFTRKGSRVYRFAMIVAPACVCIYISEDLFWAGAETSSQDLLWTHDIGLKRMCCGTLSCQ